MSYPTVSVYELNMRVKGLLDADPALKNVMVTGEISNLSVHRASGHLYFTLKDERAAVKAVMFRGSAARCRFVPENGMKVIAVGSVGVFERDGVYQIYVSELIPDGVGALMIAFEQLKERLGREGLFAPAHKKPLPAFPKRIGVITSPTGAVRRDIENVTARRWPHVELLLWGATVQGKTAAPEIIEAIKWFNKKKNVDLLIVARGGGSMEDLWCFNDEALARAIYDSEIPVISAVGHETDFTICDFVADRRAPTPSAAAELAVPDGAEQRARLNLQSRALLGAYRKQVTSLRAELNVLNARRDFSDVSVFFKDEKERVARLLDRARQSSAGRISTERLRFQRADARLLPAVTRLAEREKLRLSSLEGELKKRIDADLHARRLRLTGDVTALKSLNPLDVLLRGYAVLEDGRGILTSVKALRPGDEIKARLSDGEAKCTVAEITPRNK